MDRVQPIMWLTTAVCLLAAGSDYFLGSLDRNGSLRSWYDGPWQLLLAPYLLFVALAWWNRRNRPLGWLCLLTAATAAALGLGLHWQHYQHWRTTPLPENGQSFDRYLGLFLQLACCVVLAVLSAAIHWSARQRSSNPAAAASQDT